MVRHRYNRRTVKVARRPKGNETHPASTSNGTHAPSHHPTVTADPAWLTYLRKLQTKQPDLLTSHIPWDAICNLKKIDLHYCATGTRNCRAERRPPMTNKVNLLNIFSTFIHFPRPRNGIQFGLVCVDTFLTTCNVLALMSEIATRFSPTKKSRLPSLGFARPQITGLTY